MIYKHVLKPLLFRLEAERAHDLIYSFARVASGSTILKLFARLLYNYQSDLLSQNIWGLHFKNPVGLAAGFDKNGHIPEIFEAAGFGFTEIGSITANPNTGNPKPRSFRLPADHALVNRMGLNNDGAKTIAKRLKNKNLSNPLGINIAKTHNPEIMGDAAIEDYLISYVEAQQVADYITLNISCPNTREGKTFEDPAALDELLSALKIKDDARSTPTLVKFSADLDRPSLHHLLDICESHRIHGYVATNTSLDTGGLNTDRQQLDTIGAGGLSGRPLADKSTRMIGWISEATNGQKPIIGVGGIDSPETAWQKLIAGADLLQVYTGLIYEGPGLARTINRQLVRYLREQNMDSILQVA